jgi:hypothetical protein
MIEQPPNAKAHQVSGAQPGFVRQRGKLPPTPRRQPEFEARWAR